MIKKEKYTTLVLLTIILAGSLASLLFNRVSYNWSTAFIAVSVSSNSPTITSIFPTSRMQGSEGLEFTIFGANFTEDSRVFFDGSPLGDIKYISPNEVKVYFGRGNFEIAGDFPVKIFNIDGIESSNVVTVRVDQAVNSPIIANIFPPSIREPEKGGKPVTLLVNGTGFTPQSTVVMVDSLLNELNSSDRNIYFRMKFSQLGVFKSSTQLEISIDDGNLGVTYGKSIGTGYIRVFNPYSSGGGLFSNEKSFEIVGKDVVYY